MPTSRRGYLAVAAGTLAGAAGCLGGGGGASGETVDELPTPVIGDPEADVTVAVFEDFACPHCRSYSLEVFPQLREEYVDTGQIRYEFHDFPIPVNEQWSWAAGSAARAVQDELDAEAFFEYAHALFENQNDYSMSLIADLAEGVDATPEDVRSAAENETYRPVMRADRQQGQDMGVGGTPEVFVDGDALDGWDYDTISSALDSKL